MHRVTPKKTVRIRVGILLLKIRGGWYSLFHLRELSRISKLRKAHDGIQLKPVELMRISRAVSEFESCRMLIFGLGHDSYFWCRTNRGGRTVFLEDLKSWYGQIHSRYPEMEAYLVSYSNNITQWKELLDHPELLAMNLPTEVKSASWDVILVDGPRGEKYSAESPGRMSSIYEASRLVGKNGYVFVHDAQRTVENAYARRFLGDNHLIEKVRGRALMLVYRF
jgi:hypothetical protein